MGKWENAGNQYFLLFPWFFFFFFCRAGLQWARHSCHNDSSVYLGVCILLSEFVQTITSTIEDGFRNNLTQLFSITCRCAIWNICSGRPMVKTTFEGQIVVRTITPTIFDWFQYKFAELFFIMGTVAIWNICSGRPNVKAKGQGQAGSTCCSWTTF